MRDKEYTFVCEGCDNEFTIITSGDERPEVCPFCGEDLSQSEPDDEGDFEED